MTENEAKNFHANTDMFGQYAKIPTGRSGDLHIYKIITRFRSNGYCDTPIIFGKSTLHEEVTDVLNVIHCGVDESKVIRVALKDCEIIENDAAKELRQSREIGTVEECREAVEKQRAKKPKFLHMLNDIKYTAECKCGYRFTADIDCRYNPQFCSKCGVKFDWSEDSEGNGT